MKCTVSELLNRISSKELTEWKALYRLEPFGELRDDWRIAQALCIWINANLKEGVKKTTPADFMWLDDSERQKDDDPEQLMRALVKASRKTM